MRSICGKWKFKESKSCLSNAILTATCSLPVSRYLKIVLKIWKMRWK